MQARLSVKISNHVVQRVLLRVGERVVLGRGQVAVRLKDRAISRYHAMIELREDGLYVTDLGSRNGTFFGSFQLKSGEATLHHRGESIALGSHVISVRITGQEGNVVPEPPLLFEAPMLTKEFEVLGELGRGAIGSVWAARHRVLGRKVAIKMLNSRVESDSTEYQRFIREARIYCRIRSPHVIQLYGIRLESRRPYLIMELVQGPTARARVEDGELNVAEVIKIGGDVAKALVAITEIGVIHRDVKPHNILLSPEGLAKLGDFGLAKELQGPSFTGTSLGLGSFPYLAPEQAVRAKSADARTDIYGLGATLYHLISGRLPFRFRPKDDIIQKIERITEEIPTPLIQLREDCPPELSELVARMMAKSPDERPQTAEGVHVALVELRQRYYPDSDLRLAETWDLAPIWESASRVSGSAPNPN